MINEQVAQILARRAAQLAQVPKQQDTGETLSLLVIRLGDERYGLEAQYVFDIRPADQITPVPRTPDWITGVVNMRGRILSVFDLKRYFRLARHENEEMLPGLLAGLPAHLSEPVDHFLVLVETTDMGLVLLADEVLTVETLPTSQIQETVDTMLLNIRPDYVRGIVDPQDTGDNALLVILNLTVLLADKRLIVNEEIA